MPLYLILGLFGQDVRSPAAYVRITGERIGFALNGVPALEQEGSLYGAEGPAHLSGAP